MHGESKLPKVGLQRSECHNDQAVVALALSDDLGCNYLLAFKLANKNQRKLSDENFFIATSKFFLEN